MALALSLLANIVLVFILVMTILDRNELKKKLEDIAKIANLRKNVVSKKKAAPSSPDGKKMKIKYYD